LPMPLRRTFATAPQQGSGLSMPLRRTFASASCLRSLDAGCASASCLRWPATPALGHGQPLAEFSPQLRSSEPRVPLGPWLRQRGLSSCSNEGREFLEAGQADELVPAHLVDRPVRLLTDVDQDQHADDHAAGGPDLHAVVMVREKVSTPAEKCSAGWGRPASRKMRRTSVQ